MSMGELFDDMRRELRTAADPEAAPAMVAYMKDRYPFLGIKTPDRRRVSRPLVAAAKRADPGEVLATAERCWRESEREFQYVGADLLRAAAPRLPADALPRVRTLIETKSWWDTVDSLATHTVGAMVRSHPALAETMDRWIDDPNIWVARTAILHQLLYKDATDADRLFAYAERRATDTEFFIRKALGWALRNHARIDPDAVRAFVDDHPELSGLTRREALKHL